MGRHRPKEPSLTKLQLMLAFSASSPRPRGRRSGPRRKSAFSVARPIVVDPSAFIDPTKGHAAPGAGRLRLQQLVDVLSPVAEPRDAHARHYRTGILHHDAAARGAAETASICGLGRQRSHARDLETEPRRPRRPREPRGGPGVLAHEGHGPVAASAYWSCSSWMFFVEHIRRRACCGRAPWTLDPFTKQRERAANAAIRQAGVASTPTTRRMRPTTTEPTWAAVRSRGGCSISCLLGQQVPYRALGDAGAPIEDGGGSPPAARRGHRWDSRPPADVGIERQLRPAEATCSTSTGCLEIWCRRITSVSALRACLSRLR